MTILVVDDTPENIHLIRGILHPTYKIKAATSREKALGIARRPPRARPDPA
jgi:putative two-component system response regulator